MVFLIWLITIMIALAVGIGLVLFKKNIPIAKKIKKSTIIFSFIMLVTAAIISCATNMPVEPTWGTLLQTLYYTLMYFLLGIMVRLSIIYAIKGFTRTGKSVVQFKNDIKSDYKTLRSNPNEKEKK